MHDLFRKIAALVSRAVGTLWAALLIIGIVVASGAYFEFSDSWLFRTGFGVSLLALLILVFLQKSQNHSDRATHLKLDELIKATEGARNETAAVENIAASEIEDLSEETHGPGRTAQQPGFNSRLPSFGRKIK